MIHRILQWLRQLWSLFSPNTNTPEKPCIPSPAINQSSSAPAATVKKQVPAKVDAIKPKTAWSPEQAPVPIQEGKSRFQDLGLPNELLNGIADIGFQYCSPIQALSLPITLQGMDVIGQAQTGTGKTAAFLITIITHLLTKESTAERYNGEPRALILAPTRELALQIEKDAIDLCRHTNLSVMSVVGGMDYQKQQQRLHNQIIDILVATPGRLIDFSNKKDCLLCEVEVLIIDEADRMLDMGFIPDVKRIVRETPQKEYRQTLLFSATFNEDVLNLARSWTLQPQMISIEPEQVATDTIDQKIYIVTSKDKYPLLYNTITQLNLQRVIVFANRRDETRRLFERLKRDHINCAMLSGEVAQNKRIKTLDDFKDGKIRVLVATDVAGRGIHVDGVSHVINYALPEDPEDYVHRIGRTGRAGATGTAISFACEDDSFLIPDIENLLGEKLNCQRPPNELLLPVANR